MDTFNLRTDSVSKSDKPVELLNLLEKKGKTKTRQFGEKISNFMLRARKNTMPSFEKNEHAPCQNELKKENIPAQQHISRNSQINEVHSKGNMTVYPDWFISMEEISKQKLEHSLETIMREFKLKFECLQTLPERQLHLSEASRSLAKVHQLESSQIISLFQCILSKEDFESLVKESTNNVSVQIMQTDPAVEGESLNHIEREILSLKLGSRGTKQYPKRIDDDERREPLSCNEYITDIFSFFKEAELQILVSPHTLAKPTSEITPMMRSVLVDWLVDVHWACVKKLQMAPETLHSAVMIVDRFLYHQQVARCHFQLLGVSALLLASKYEDIYPPSIGDLRYFTKNTYTMTDIMSMEANIVRVLNFKFSLPSCYQFMLRYLKAGDANLKIVQLTNYFAEQALHENSLLVYRPSHIAACCVYAARKSEKRLPWDETLALYTGYSEPDLLECLKLMANTFGKNPKVQAVHQKFSNQSFGKVSGTKLENC